MIARALRSNRLYEDILQVTSNYLGPAAQRFIDRQIISHLNKAPEDVAPKDLKKLVEWSRVALALLTDDKKIINEYVKNMNGLTHEDR